MSLDTPVQNAETAFDRKLSFKNATQRFGRSGAFRKRRRKTKYDFGDLNITHLLRSEGATKTIDQLHSAGFPEECLEDNLELLTFIATADRVGVKSKNPVYEIVDRQGNHWIAKIHTDLDKAQFAAAANSTFAEEMSFIVPGKRELIMGTNYALQIQQKVSSELHNVLMPTLYWVNTLALYHTTGLRAVEKHGIHVPNGSLKSVDELMDSLDRLTPFDGSLDRGRIREAVEYIHSVPYIPSLIHTDGKADNRLGPYWLDLDNSIVGPSNVDLGMIMFSDNVHPRQWEKVARAYSQTRHGSYDLAEHYHKGIDAGRTYSAVVEIVGSAKRMETRLERARIEGLITRLSCAWSQR